uniref:Uncharacterized protein n=1 Tax=Moniliophthora roreri TaxID=221103 RepID=A0A0W0F944_MONRR
MAPEPLLATRAQRLFISTICIQAIVVLVMVAITFRLVEDEVSFTDGLKTLPCYLALFALAEIFELIMAFDALRMRNIIQLIGILLFHLALLVFAAVQVDQTKDAIVTMSGSDCEGPGALLNCDVPGSLWRRVQPYLIIAPCAIAVAWVAMCFWIKALYAEFGWAIFHIVGANPKMKTMYQVYQIMLCLCQSSAILTPELERESAQRNRGHDPDQSTGIHNPLNPLATVLLVMISQQHKAIPFTVELKVQKPSMDHNFTQFLRADLFSNSVKFDFFFFTAVTMQLLILVLDRDSAEFGVTIAAIPVVLTLLALCGLAVQREIKWLMTISLVLMLAAESYFFKLVRFYEPATRGQYNTTRVSLTIFTIVAFLLLFATFAVGLKTFADFDRGLAESKVNGGSYVPMHKMEILKGNDFIVEKPTRPTYTSQSSGGMQHNNSYTAGTTLGPRISIE